MVLLVTPNRTILELKQQIIIIVKQVWWNSQSNHTGIETTEYLLILFDSWTPNRTILELKRIFTE